MTHPSQHSPTLDSPTLAPSILWPSLDEMSDKVDSFYASPFGDGWDSYETSDLLDHIAWFAGTHDSADIFAWDDTRAVQFLEHILDRAHLADPTRAALFPALLRGWVRYVGSREQIPAIETRRTLAAIERAEPVFFTNMAPLFSDYMTFEDPERSTIFEESSETVTPHP